MFLFQFLLQAGVFFVVPLFLSVVLELSAIETGVRILPLSVALLLAAVGVPKLWPQGSPRTIVRVGVVLLLGGIVTLMAGIDVDASAGVVTVPMLLVGLGIGALASQLGAVTVSAVPNELSGEVGGLQNTATNLGASLGTALAGSVMIILLTSAFLTTIQSNPDVPQSLKDQAQVELASGVPFVSDTDLSEALATTEIPPSAQTQILDDYASARARSLDAALGVLALLALVSLFFTGRIPERQPTGDDVPDAVDEPAPA